jgi:hypothetical protein
VSNAFKMTVCLEDGTVHEVSTNLRDQMRYEAAARAGKWGPTAENLIRFETFVAWSALERRGLIDGIKFDEFDQLVEQIDSDVISPRPTQAGPSSDSSSS